MSQVTAVVACCTGRGSCTANNKSEERYKCTAMGPRPRFACLLCTTINKWCLATVRQIPLVAHPLRLRTRAAWLHPAGFSWARALHSPLHMSMSAAAAAPDGSAAAGC